MFWPVSSPLHNAIHRGHCGILSLQLLPNVGTRQYLRITLWQLPVCLQFLFLFIDGYSLICIGYSASLDFILVFISTTIIWNLNLSVSRRIQLAALLGTGIL